ncbi:GPCR, PTH11-type [Xylariomycetidae sp. FL0641]|nr:GPCR, PTH11-type [Xylariomycetidae sp. FL0641]
MASTDPAQMAAAMNMTVEELGEMMQAQAYAEPSIQPQGLASAVEIVVLVTVILATIIISLRVYARSGIIQRSATVWGWADTFAILGYFALLTSSIFAVYAAHYGLGTHDKDLNQFLMIRCAEYMLYSQVTYGISMPLVKASVVFTLLRITNEKKYVWTLWAMQFVATAMALVGVLASLLHCRPTKAYWNPLLGECGDMMVVVNIGYVWTATGIITDWICAILPYFIVRKLQMNRNKKMTVMAILGLGAVASTATIVRAPYLQYYLAPTDQLFWNGYISIWCQLESGLGLIAASLPALRTLFKQYRERSQQGGYGTKGSKLTSGSLGGSRSRGKEGTQMDTLSSTGKTTVVSGKWKRLEDETSSAKHIIQETTVSVETSSMTDDEHKRYNKHMV